MFLMRFRHLVTVLFFRNKEQAVIAFLMIGPSAAGPVIRLSLVDFKLTNRADSGSKITLNFRLV
jgi:hypothetical protein